MDTYTDYRKFSTHEVKGRDFRVVIRRFQPLDILEQVSHFNIEISFRQHAAVGIPTTLMSLAILVGWIAAVG